MWWSFFVPGWLSASAVSEKVNTMRRYVVSERMNYSYYCFLGLQQVKGKQASDALDNSAVR